TSGSASRRRLHRTSPRARGRRRIARNEQHVTWLDLLAIGCLCVPALRDAVVLITLAVVGFGAAQPPQDTPFPTGCGGRVPVWRSHNQWERRDFGGTYVPPSLPENADCVSPEFLRANETEAPDRK